MSDETDLISAGRNLAIWQTKTSTSEPSDHTAWLLADEIERLIVERERLERNLVQISAAIGASEFMDPPDGGDVPLHEQVRRMRNALIDERIARRHEHEENERLTDELNEARARLAGARAELDWMKYRIGELRYPCTCDPAYYERGRSAPDCLADLCGDEVRELLGEPIECLGRLARAALSAEEEKG